MAAFGLHLLGLGFTSSATLRATSPVVPASSSRGGLVEAKFVGAALAAAFASKDEAKDDEPKKALTIAEQEELVVESIRSGLDGGPTKAFSALGDFGRASGELAQSWLTPSQLEKCASFWGGGSALLARDARQFRLRRADLEALPWFALLAANTFPWTPLLTPLVSRALNRTDDSTFVPSAFRTDRLAALQRLKREPCMSTHLERTSADYRSPQNIDEGVAFFSDGTRMLLRDARRGRLTAYGDSYAAYGYFLLLTFSTFPLTPLLLPLIDKRRTEGQQSDYVPAAFRANRLATFARYRARVATPMRTPKEILHAAALLPWTRLRHGVYVDEYVTAVQRFDAASGDNENGVYGVLGYGGLELSVRGPFKWPSPAQRTVCAFQPTHARCRLGPLEREFALPPTDADGQESAVPFAQQRVTRLPFFKWLLVDDEVAVAQGRSGGVAVWARTDVV